MKSPSRSLSVVVVNDFGHPEGGASRVAIESARGLAARGHAVTFFCGTGPAAVELSAAGVQVTVLGRKDILRDPNRFRAGVRGLWNPSAASALERLLRDKDPGRTVVHVHAWTKSLSASVFRAARAAGFPLALTLHDYFTVCPNGGLFDYQREQRCTLQPLSPACILRHCDPRRYSHKIWRVARQIIQGTAGGVPSRIGNLILLSRLSYDLVRRHIAPETRIFWVRNPCGFEQSPRAAVSENHHYLYVGRLSAEKGVLVLAEAARRAKLAVRFVGDGECRPGVEAAVGPGHVTGWVSAEEVKRELASARALVLPSVWHEGQPLVTLEAASLGVPAVVSRTCAASEVIEDGVTGLHVTAGDPDDLASKLRSLDDNERLDRLSRAAHARFPELASDLDDHVDALEKVYDAILRTPPPFGIGGDAA